MPITKLRHPSPSTRTSSLQPLAQRPSKPTLCTTGDPNMHLTWAFTLWSAIVALGLFLAYLIMNYRRRRILDRKFSRLRDETLQLLEPRATMLEPFLSQAHLPGEVPANGGAVGAQPVVSEKLRSLIDRFLGWLDWIVLGLQGAALLWLAVAAFRGATPAWHLWLAAVLLLPSGLFWVWLGLLSRKDDPIAEWVVLTIFGLALFTTGAAGLLDLAQSPSAPVDTAPGPPISGQPNRISPHPGPPSIGPSRASRPPRPKPTISPVSSKT